NHRLPPPGTLRALPLEVQPTMCRIVAPAEPPTGVVYFSTIGMGYFSTIVHSSGRKGPGRRDGLPIWTPSLARGGRGQGKGSDPYRTRALSTERRCRYCAQMT